MSPTKRLIQMKNAESKHKKITSTLEKNGKGTVKYGVSPQKSYVVSQKEGKLDYGKMKKKGLTEEIKN